MRCWKQWCKCFIAVVLLFCNICVTHHSIISQQSFQARFEQISTLQVAKNRNRFYIISWREGGEEEEVKCQVLETIEQWQKVCWLVVVFLFHVLFFHPFDSSPMLFHSFFLRSGEAQQQNNGAFCFFRRQGKQQERQRNQIALEKRCNVWVMRTGAKSVFLPCLA